MVAGEITAGEMVMVFAVTGGTAGATGFLMAVGVTIAGVTGAAAILTARMNGKFRRILPAQQEISV